MNNYNKNFKSQEENGCNREEHKQWNRRSFLQALGLVGGGTLAFANTSLSASKQSPLVNAINEAESDRVLIIIQLNGGNDNLSTIVPVYDYDTYARARPKIRIKENDLISLNDDFGLPKYATKLEELWGDGRMKVAHGVGYKNSTLSHFKGQDNWATANPDNLQEATGWMGRYFEGLYPDYLFNPPEKPAAIQIGNRGNVTFSGYTTDYGFSVANPDKLIQVAKTGTLYDVTNLPPCQHGDLKGFLRNIANSTFNYAGVINEAYNKSSDFGDYPRNDLAAQLSVIARMIKGNLGTKVYLVQQEGFDTHADQLKNHEYLIKILSESVAHFYKDLANAGWDDKVLCMTTSEFGRRVDENGSGGTAHGMGGSSMFFGTPLNGSGFVGKHPDLSDLDGGNLKFNRDFRELYVSVLTDWLCANPGLVKQALFNKDYDTVDLGFECNTLSTGDVSHNGLGLNHYVVYEGDTTILNLEMTTTGHVDIQLYNLLGQEVGSLKNEILFVGKHTINVNDSIGRLTPGQYVYRIVTSDSSYSKSLVIN